MNPIGLLIISSSWHLVRLVGFPRELAVDFDGSKNMHERLGGSDGDNVINRATRGFSSQGESREIQGHVALFVCFGTKDSDRVRSSSSNQVAVRGFDFDKTIIKGMRMPNLSKLEIAGNGKPFFRECPIMG